jgi:hypothetical protein
MASERPPDRSSSASSGDGERNEHGEPAQERYGPLEVARHVKDDGRALLIYAHVREEAP